jgi:hypothetical protein
MLKSTTETAPTYEKMQNTNSFKNIVELFTNFETSLIYTISFVMGTAAGIHETYLFIYLEDLGMYPYLIFF